MSYIDTNLKIAIAEKLGLQGLHTNYQERFGQKFILEYYWVAFVRFETENEEIVRWLIAVTKTNLWTHAYIAFMDFDYQLTEEKILKLTNWDDPIMNHLSNLDAVANLDDTIDLDNSDSFELLFETTRTLCHFEIKQLPDNPNLENLWRKLNQVREFFLKP
jgi:hypothetical protein